MSGRPLDVLEESLDGDVTVHLKDGRIFHGTLAGYDQHMNLVLESPSAENEASVIEPDVQAAEDTTIIRGDNVVTLNV